MTEQFFIATPLNFEELALQEFKEKYCLLFPDLEVPEVNSLEGGFEVNLPIEHGFLMNHHLKIPNRILVRLEQFKCRDFPKLFKKISKMDWRKWLVGQMPTIKASCHKSRLIHTTRIEKAVVDGISKYYKGSPPKAISKEELDIIPTTLVFIRIEEDLCTISIDCSGEHLSKRGYKKYVNEAPLRENLAAALSYFLTRDQIPFETIVDPLCGSGTFLLEAALFYHCNTHRSFSYQNFPMGKKLNFDHLPLKSVNMKLVGKDLDPECIKLCQENFKLAKLQNFQLTTANALDEKIEEYPRPLVICNPPYGIRIKQSFKFSTLLNSMLKNYSPAHWGMLIPSSENLNYDSLSFKNGGIRVKFFHGEKL